ncbi:hypothetical protein ES708_03849 [subsurface metagenome]
MNIRDWSLDRIMQLPDACFGQQWPIGLAGQPLLDTPAFDISEAALPDTTVIWEVLTWTAHVPTVPVIIEIYLGDHLPATDAEFRAMEPLFSGVRDVNNRPSSFEANRNMFLAVSRIKMAAKAQGRRLVARFSTDNATAIDSHVILVVSSIPTEVPDWLCSGRV